MSNKQQMKTEKQQLPLYDLTARFNVSSYDEEKRTIDVVASTGARGRRGGMNYGFYEELVISDESVVLDRLNNGAPALEMHDSMWNPPNRQGLGAVLGVVESARIESVDGKNAIVATIRFSKREEIQDTIRDITDGIVRNISIGYKILSAEEVREEGVDLPILRVTKFEPMEVSFVSIGFDDSAKTRESTNIKTFDCIVKRSKEGVSDMKQEQKVVEQTTENTRAGEQVSNPAPQIDENKVRDDAIKAERERVSKITALTRKHNLDDSVAQNLIERGASVEDAKDAVLDALEKREEPTQTSSKVEVGEDLNVAGRNEAIVNAIQHRGLGAKVQLTDQGRKYASMSLCDIARMFVRESGANDMQMSTKKIVQRAYHSTSDFPAILEDTINKSLRDEYSEAPQTWGAFTRMTTASDFKSISRTQLGDVSELKAIVEGAEYTHGTVGDAKEVYNVVKYGRKMALTWESMVNDDLDAFTRLPAKLGRRARDLESDVIYDIFGTNPLLGDGIAWFANGHDNLNQGGAAALDVDKLGDMRGAMRLQRGISPKTGETGSLLNLSLEYLLVPAALETVAERLVSQNFLADSQGNINPFAGRLRTIVEPRLDAQSTTAYYGLASVAAIDIIEMARLIGEEGPVIETKEGWDVDGMEVKIRHVFGTKAIDFRGVQKNAGA